MLKRILAIGGSVRVCALMVPVFLLVVAARWNCDLGGGGWGNAELEYYTRSKHNAALDGRGHLVITARPNRARTPKGTPKLANRRRSGRRLTSSG